jgi:hypothetical protein
MIETTLENIHAVLTEIRDLMVADKLCDIAKEPAKKPSKKEAKEPTKETPTSEVTPDTETPTLADLKVLGKRITEAGKFAEAKEWIRSKDATSLQTLAPEFYGEFAEFAKTLLA